jgi:hypothetical protein
MPVPLRAPPGHHWNGRRFPRSLLSASLRGIDSIPSHIEAGFFDSQRKEVNMLKVRILATCSHCHGEAYQPVGRAEDGQGHTYIRHIPCPACEGSGNEPKWIDLQDFAKLMRQAVCPHDHTSFQGNMHFNTGDVWDDIHEVCDDCGANLDRLNLADYIKDDN